MILPNDFNEGEAARMRRGLAILVGGLIALACWKAFTGGTRTPAPRENIRQVHQQAR